MKTKYLNEKDIPIIKDLLLQGEIVAIPTDTVFGLAVLASDPQAISNLREVKNRPDEKVFAYMVDQIDKIEKVCELTDRDRYLIKRWLPGPITFIFNKKDNDLIVSQSSLKTLAIRIPNHQLILELIGQMEIGLYVPSANISGQPTCLTSQEVSEQFDQKIAGIVQMDALGQQASTIIDCSQDKLTCLREGIISLQEIEEDLNEYISAN